LAAAVFMLMKFALSLAAAALSTDPEDVETSAFEDDPENTSVTRLNRNSVALFSL